MKTFRQFNEDIEARNAALRQRADDQMAATKQKIRDKKSSDAAAADREAMKDEIKRELKNEVYDPEIQKRSQIRKSGEGGRIGADRKKSAPEIRRQKAIGGGKTAPVASYKPRKDIGQQKQASDRVQAPTKERGSTEVKQSYADKAKAERKKAAQARIAARKSGGEVKKDTTTSKDKEKAASKLLTKKSAKKVNPDYKPQKASGKTAAERKALTKKGERTLRDIQLKNLNKKSEKELKNPVTQKEITRRNKAK